MIYIFDAYYLADQVRTACVVIEDWSAHEATTTIVKTSPISSGYISGQFYKRELPGILEVLQEVELIADDLIIIDGYVFLDDDQKMGLGAHLHGAINRSCPVIGVAKKSFRSLDKACLPALRGQSTKPLYVTAVDYDLVNARDQVVQMRGPYRIPDMLKLADQLSKGIE
ncbi:MAG: endonuclease V [Cyanobacteria bacterium J06649_11]